MHRSVISFAPKNKSPNGRLVLFRSRFTGVQVKAHQSPHQLLEKLRSLQFPRGLRVLITLSDVPPRLSSEAVWSPILNEKEIGREEA
ncbi:hypothetical protein NJF45_06835, partial [Stenotrophomonas maltophilia]|uniref:hypothetical protein n=1 Tax=Stenotrophomonas maltophilia TaxID=40324 RepID=UPI0020978F9B